MKLIFVTVFCFNFSKLTFLHYKLNHPRFYQKYRELQARIKANSCPVLPATQINNVVAGGGGVGSGNTTNNYIVQRSASLKDNRVHLRYFLFENLQKTSTLQVFICIFYLHQVITYYKFCKSFLICIYFLT